MDYWIRLYSSGLYQPATDLQPSANNPPCTPIVDRRATYQANLDHLVSKVFRMHPTHSILAKVLIANQVHLYMDLLRHRVVDWDSLPETVPCLLRDLLKSIPGFVCYREMILGLRLDHYTCLKVTTDEFLDYLDYCQRHSTGINITRYEFLRYKDPTSSISKIDNGFIFETPSSDNNMPFLLSELATPDSPGDRPTARQLFATRLHHGMPSPTPCVAHPAPPVAPDSIATFQEASMGSDCENTLLPRRTVDSDDKSPTIFGLSSEPNNGELHRATMIPQQSTTQVQRNIPKTDQSSRNGQWKMQRHKRKWNRRKRKAQANKRKAQANKRKPKQAPKREPNDYKSKQSVPSIQVDNTNNNSSTVNIVTPKPTYLDITTGKRSSSQDDDLQQMLPCTLVKTKHGELHQLVPSPPVSVQADDCVTLESKVENRLTKGTGSTLLSTTKTRLPECIDEDTNHGAEDVSNDTINDTHGDFSFQGIDDSITIIPHDYPIQHGLATATNDQPAHTGDKGTQPPSTQVEPLEEVGIPKSIVNTVALIISTLDESISFIRNLGDTTVSTNDPDSVSDLHPANVESPTIVPTTILVDWKPGMEDGERPHKDREKDGEQPCKDYKHSTFPDGPNDKPSDVEQVDRSKESSTNFDASILDDPTASAYIDSTCDRLSSNQTTTFGLPSISSDTNPNSHWKPTEKDGKRPLRDREKYGEHCRAPYSGTFDSPTGSDSPPKLEHNFLADGSSIPWTHHIIENETSKGDPKLLHVIPFGE